MVETIQANSINLHKLKNKFGLKSTNEEYFFREWQENLPELTEEEKQALDEVKANYFHLSEYPMLESIAKMVVLSPLLKLAGFYRPPFYIVAEKEVRIRSEDKGTVITGRLDLLVFIPNLWILIIEAKGTKYSLEVGIPQVLAYMLDSPNSEKPAYGFVTNGIDFIFLKLNQKNSPIYALSYSFSLYRGNDLYQVLRILRNLNQLAQQELANSD